MAENKSTFQNAAMQYGTIMGLFWIFKFAFVPLGINVPFLQLLFFLLTLCVPFIGYAFTKRYRILFCENNLRYGHAFSFLFFMYLYASMLVAVAHYIYFRFIDGGLLSTYYQESFHELTKMTGNPFSDSIGQMEEAIQALFSQSPLDITFYFLSNNLFYCFILAAITALFVMRRKTNE